MDRLVKIRKTARYGFAALAFAAMGLSHTAAADEVQARHLFKAMSDYLGKQKTMSFDVDTSLEIITKDGQKLALTNSGSITITRPDKIHMTRRGGFAEAELFFDGKTLSLLLKGKNIYAQQDLPGSIDNLITELRDKFHRPVPAADLLTANVYAEMMPSVVNVKDLGSGFIRGVECDHLAFRTDETDWQIWITQGPQPRPMRLVISSAKIAGMPEYQVDIMNFKTGRAVSPVSYAFTPPRGSKKVLPSGLMNFDELPDLYKPQP